MARCYNGYYDSNGNIVCDDSWDNWVRWLVLALIIVGAFLIFFLFRYVAFPTSNLSDMTS